MFHPASLRRWALLSLCLLAVAAPAAAQSPASGVFSLDVELFRGTQAEFGDVVAEEDGAGGIHMVVSLDPTVTGPRASVHHVLVSMGMGGLPAGLSVVPDDPDGMRMIVHPQRRPWLTMGAEFGAIVSMEPRHDCRHHRHHGHHPCSAGPVQEVGFTLMADEPMSLGDVLGMTSTRNGVVTQIGVVAFGLDLGRHHRKPALLGGLFQADPVDDGTVDDGTGTGGTGDGQVPPGCIGVRDPATGEIIALDCE
jgi:hypothetical protein